MIRWRSDGGQGGDQVTFREASGKKVSGGLHKFDASEVDIEGGAATADDFMSTGDFMLTGDDDFMLTGDRP